MITGWSKYREARKNDDVLQRSFDGELAGLDVGRLTKICTERPKAADATFRSLCAIRQLLKKWVVQETSAELETGKWDLWSALEPELRKIDRQRELKRQRYLSWMDFRWIGLGRYSKPNYPGLVGGFLAAGLILGFVFQTRVFESMDLNPQVEIAQKYESETVPSFHVENQLFAPSSAKRSFGSYPRTIALESASGPASLELVSNSEDLEVDSLKVFPAQNQRFQVDWMRSRRPVSIVPAKRENAPPIIWVRNNR